MISGKGRLERNQFVLTAAEHAVHISPVYIKRKDNFSMAMKKLSMGGYVNGSD
jgi:hypothetical protein